MFDSHQMDDFCDAFYRARECAYVRCSHSASEMDSDVGRDAKSGKTPSGAGVLWRERDIRSSTCDDQSSDSISLYAWSSSNALRVVVALGLTVACDTLRSSAPSPPGTLYAATPSSSSVVNGASSLSSSTA